MMMDHRYPDEVNCSWLITAQKSIRLTFSDDETGIDHYNFWYKVYVLVQLNLKF